MRQRNFTEEQILEAVKKVYDKGICTDFMDDALCAETLEEAVEILVVDSAFWNGDF